MNRRTNLVLSIAAIALTISHALPRTVAAQTPADREGVRRAALDYLEGFYEGDTAKLVRSIVPTVYKYGFDRADKATTYTGEVMSWPEILGYARNFKAKGRTTPASAARKVDLLDVLDQTAAAKVTAWWGTDYLLLGKVNGHWMISHILWQSPPPAAK